MIAEVSDNIADHSFRVAIIGVLLAQLEECDKAKVLIMCLFHDLAEGRTGDANFLNKQYLEIDEEGARRDQMEGLPGADGILKILEEFEERQTKESIVAKDADKLDQMILQQEYFYKDGYNHNRWQNHTEKYLKTESAKKLAKEIRKTNPFEWLYRITSEKRARGTIKE